MSSIMRWRNGLMGLSSIAKAPVSHGVQNPMILRQSDASRCPGLQTPHADSRRTPRERFSPSPLSGRNAASQFNVEYRAADATACPHLVLAAVARAGLEGVQAG